MLEAAEKGVVDLEAPPQIPANFKKIAYLPSVVEACLRDPQATFDTDPITLGRDWVDSSATSRCGGRAPVFSQNFRAISWASWRWRIGSVIVVPGARLKRHHTLAPTTSPSREEELRVEEVSSACPASQGPGPWMSATLETEARDLQAVHLQPIEKGSLPSW
jgi:hypothetical protein